LGGCAIGTQQGNEGSAFNFNDSLAYLSGFPPDQKASMVIHKTAGVGGGAYEEVEVLLRWSVGALRQPHYGPTNSWGYEVNLAYDGSYVLISRFKEDEQTGVLFNSLTAGSPITTLGVQDGDILTAWIVGNEITATLTRNGVVTVLGKGSDLTAQPITTGNPGVGFFRWNNGSGVTDPNAFCATHFEASSL
jgi:hypothetical protein